MLSDAERIQVLSMWELPHKDKASYYKQASPKEYVTKLSGRDPVNDQLQKGVLQFS